MALTQTKSNSRHPDADVVVLLGPTGSGKSALALRLADRLPVTIINCDAMQVYADLRVITARPTDEEMRRVPHKLYGFLPASTRGNAAAWLDHALTAIDATLADKRLPLLVGGTGLYVKALMDGLSPVPEIPEAVRIAVAERHATLGAEKFYRELCARDPNVKRKLVAGNTQRVLRAAEVIEATGVSLYDFQEKNKPTPPTPWRFHVVTLRPPRPEVYAAVNARFAAMLEAGALDEVRALKEQKLDPTLPAMKAHGVPELIQHLDGKMTRDAALAQAQKNTRHYVKRQFTWMAHQVMAGLVLETLPDDKTGDEIVNFLAPRIKVS